MSPEPMLLRDAISIPTEVRQGDLVFKLTDATDQTAETVAQYVVTDQLLSAFSEAAALVGAAVKEHSSKAAFLSGSFGAGKSNFMGMLQLLLARDLSGLEPAVLMVDGAEFGGSMCVVALVVTSDGTKVPVGLRLGDTENATVVKALLADLVDRGLRYDHGLLVVIDGAKALASAVGSVFGDLALVQRCQIHKRRNVKDHLPKTSREAVDARLRGAFADPDPDAGLRKAKALAAELERTHPDAAGLRSWPTTRRDMSELRLESTIPWATKSARSRTCATRSTSLWRATAFGRRRDPGTRRDRRGRDGNMRGAL